MSNPLSQDLSRLVAQAEASAPAHDPWRQRIHLCPPTGWLNDPCGLCQLGGEYHAFFQYAPFDAEGGLKLWGHCVSTDLLHWRYLGAPLMPDAPFDCHGAYTGSALVEDGVLRVAYTGNVKREGEGLDYVSCGREGNTVLVESADGGRSFGPKRLVLTNDDYPADLSCHVRDPKLWREGGRYLMLLGARRSALASVPSARSRYCALHGERAGVDAGEALVFASGDLVSWRLLRRVSTSERFGFMWECPDYFELGAGRGERAGSAGGGGPVSGGVAHVLSVCPQGLEGGSWDRRNTYQSGYFLLDRPLTQGADPVPDGFFLWDAGFDFYAPQSFEAADGRRILIAWMGMPDTPGQTNKTLAAGWQHCLTIPREIAPGEGRLLQRPARELEALRARRHAAGSALENQGSPTFDLVVDGVAESARLVFSDELSLSWSRAESWLELRFLHEGAAGASGGRTVRREPLGQLRNLRVVGDRSSIEVFANDGELCMSTRYYPEAYGIVADAPGAALTLWELEA